MTKTNKFAFVYRTGRSAPRSRTVWLVQRLVAGKWQNQRQKNGMPLLGGTEYQAEQLIRELDGSFTYRVLKIQD